MKHSMNLLT